MSDELQENETRIASGKHPNNYVKAVIGKMNDGNDEVILTAMGQAQQNLERVLGKLYIQRSLESSVYNLPDFSVVAVEEYTETFENDEGEDTDVDGKEITIEVE